MVKTGIYALIDPNNGKQHSDLHKLALKTAWVNRKKGDK